MKSFSFLGALGWVSLVACSGAEPPGFGDGGTTDGSTTTGDGSTTGEGGMRADAGMCPNGMFPTFDKGCTSNDNCSFGLHQIDCCGTLSAIGFNHAYKDMFEAAEKAWRATCPGCGCPAGPTKVESGMTCANPAVKCSSSGTGGTGKCVTYCP